MTNIALGPFHLDTRNDLLLRGSEPMALGQRAIALLRALVERPGALVSKDALIEAAWPGQAVDESNLTVQIAALRRIFGSEPGGERWIETLSRRGYRFVGPIVPEPRDGSLEEPDNADAGRGLAATPHRDAEQRQITVMSCELVGATAGADGRDLEDWRAAIANFARGVSETVERHAGFLVGRLGNSWLVLFGYPMAHEHDAERAVRAGLELCAGRRTPRPATDRTMRCRIGIETGLAIVGDLSRRDALRDEIVGDPLHLATQLQRSTQPDSVVVGPTTHRLIGDLFD